MIIRILTVDDDPINQLVLADALANGDYIIDQAADGELAWERLCQTSYDLVLLDRFMPKLDGLGLLRRMKADPAMAKIATIMQTAATAQEEIREAMESGAFYYLAKPFSPEVLRVLVAGVAADIRERNSQRDLSSNLIMVLELMVAGEFCFRTPSEARALAVSLANLCEKPDDTGIGLLELMINAIEHGNLGITYAEKSALRKAWQWESEVELRLAMTPWQNRIAKIETRLTGDDVEFIITDQGEGFNWQEYLKLDPKRAFDVHGRGIALANSISFHHMEYHGCGNKVVARTTLRKSPGP